MQMATNNKLCNYSIAFNYISTTAQTNDIKNFLKIATSMKMN